MPISLSMFNNSYIKNSGFQVTEPVNESAKDIFNKAPRIQLIKFKGIEGAMVIPTDIQIDEDNCEWAITGKLISQGTEIIKHIMWMGSLQPKTDFVLVMNSQDYLIRCWNLPDGYGTDIFKYMQDTYNTMDFLGAYLIKLDGEQEELKRINAISNLSFIDTDLLTEDNRRKGILSYRLKVKEGDTVWDDRGVRGIIKDIDTYNPEGKCIGIEFEGEDGEIWWYHPSKLSFEKDAFKVNK